MKNIELLFLGTGAADWDVNNHDKDAGDRFFSSMLCNESLLLDCGPCIFDFEKTHGYSGLFSKVNFVLVTHSHSDHFSDSSLAKLCSINRDIAVVADKSLNDRITAACGAIKIINPEINREIPLGDYHITALKSNHSVAGSAEQTMHYIVKNADKSRCFFYGLDGGWLLNSTWHALRKHKFDCMIFDGTSGDIPGDFRIFEHNNLTMVKEMVSTFRVQGLFTADGKALITHMARTLHTDHQTLKQNLEPYGITPAYDNMKIIL